MKFALSLPVLIISLIWGESWQQVVPDLNGGHVFESTNGAGEYDWRDVDTAFGKLWALSDDGLIINSEDGIDWSIWEQDTIVWRSITSNGSKAVMAGRDGNVRVSSDGVKWDTSSIETPETIVKIMWSGKSFVAMNLAGDFYSSIDGLKWEPLGSIGHVGMLVDFTVNNSIFVAVGAPNLIFKSVDGVDWTNYSRKISPERSFNAVAWGNAGFVIVAGDSSWRSQDGEKWDASGSGGLISEVIWDGTRYIAMGSSYLASLDGLNWTTLINHPDGWVYGLYSGPQGYVAVCRFSEIWFVASGKLEVPAPINLKRRVPSPKDLGIVQYDLLGRPR